MPNRRVLNRATRRRMGEVRVTDIGGHPGVTLHAIRPGVVDDMGSVWAANTFDRSLATRLPTLCFNHDWSDPLGPSTGFRIGPDGPEIDFLFSDFDAVPQARRAHAQVKDGTIRDCSVGFYNAKRRDPTPEERDRYPGIREYIYEADLDEVSLVLSGAVPGARVLSVRSGEGVATVREDDVLMLAKKVAAGELTHIEAKAALALLAETAPEEEAEAETPETSAEEPDPDVAEEAVETEEAVAEPEPDLTDAEIDAALEMADRSR